MVSSKLNHAQLALVTGASGFIGRVLCQRLKKRGMRVRVLTRHEEQGPWDDVVIGNLMDSLPHEALIGVDTIFHLAGKAHALSETKQDETYYHAINAEGTRKLLKAAQAAGVRQFIFFSSVKVMGEGGKECLDESADVLPETPYGKSKLEAEKLVIDGGYVPEPVVLRLSMVYGPTRKGNLPRMIEAVAKGRFPSLPEVENKRSMIHVKDVVQAALLVSENPEAAGKTYILTDGQVYSTRKIYEWICTALDKPVQKWTIPICVLRVLAKVGDGIGALRNRRFMFDSDALDKLVGSAVYSSEKIVQELNFHPEHDLRSALPEIVAYLN